MSQQNEVTELLGRVKHGGQDAKQDLIRLVQVELREIAGRYMRRERPDHTLQATVLVDDACLKLLGNAASVDWESRAHFYRAAARAMRHLLIDHQRGKKAAKRPPSSRRQPLDELANVIADSSRTDLLALDEALEKLAQLDPRQCEVVELHHFGGYRLEETAMLLGISLTTAKGEWAAAKAWLHRELTRGDKLIQTVTSNEEDSPSPKQQPG